MVTLSPLLQGMVRKRLEDQMTSKVTIYRGDTGEFDPDTLEVSGLTNAQTIYTGKARLYTENTSAFMTADGSLAMLSVSMSLPVSSPELYKDDLAVVTSDSRYPGQRAYTVMTRAEGGFFDAVHTYSLQGLGRSRSWEGAGQ